MKIVIYDRQNRYDDNFLKFLKTKMIYRGLAIYNPKKTILHEVYINQFYRTKLRKYITAREIIISGLYNITWKRYGDKIVIEIDSNQIVIGTSAKLNEICKLINYGTLDLPAYPIFDDLFTYFKLNIDRWYDYYGNGGV